MLKNFNRCVAFAGLLFCSIPGSSRNNVGYSTPGFIPWLASLKLNFTSYGTGIILKKDAQAQCPKLPIELISQARDHAFLLLPHLSHFDYG